MKKKVSIARALKEKNRVAGRMRQVLREIEKENSKDKDVPRGVDVLEMYKLANELRNRLIEIKTAIAVANQKIVGKIVELSELKSQIVFLNELPIFEGVKKDGSYYGSEKTSSIFTAILSKAQVLKDVDAHQKRANQLQDELDDFNATMKVEIEIDENYAGLPQPKKIPRSKKIPRPVRCRQEAIDVPVEELKEVPLDIFDPLELTDFDGLSE